MRILAIESSCDETAAAIVDDGITIVQNVVATSSEFHKKYGGIVPEIAAREQIKNIVPVLQETLGIKGVDGVKGIDAIAVAVGPGLIGSLLVGVETAKTLAFVTKKPLIPVNHVLAHMYANFLRHSERSEESSGNASLDPSQKLGMTDVTFPAISLVVSGGHTELFFMKDEKTMQWLGGTVDDAAGEAFDKTARLLGFENGGGPAIQKAATQCHPGLDPGSRSKMDSGSGAGMTRQIKLPRPLMHDKSLNFSFSGLKTAIMREWKKFDDHSEDLVAAFAYEVQEAITDVLVAKTITAAEAYGAKSILVSGGVAANNRLREKIAVYDSRFTIHVPPIALCTDNAAYIGSYAFFRGVPTDWHTVTAVPNLSVEITT